MDKNQIKDLLEKIPFAALAFVFVAYTAYDYYQFENGAESPLVAKRVQTENVRNENTQLAQKVKQAYDFLKTLEIKRAEIRALAQKLDEMKATLSDTLDIPDFMKTTITEAKKVGLTVLGLKPASRAQKEYYTEQPFELKFRGIFVQLVVFLERLSNVQKIVRIDNFDMKTVGSSSARYVELEGVIEIKTYQYLGSRADEVGKQGGSVPTPGQGGR